MERSDDSSEWISDEDGQQQARLAGLKLKRMCQVPGCTADLEAIGKPYCKAKRICPTHMKADVIPVRNQMKRFCLQCGVLEPLSLFDYTKRSCRDSLNKRVVKHPVKRKRITPYSSNAGSQSGDWLPQLAWAAAAPAAAPAAAFGGTTVADWNAACIPLPVGRGRPAADTAAWATATGGVMLPSSCWLGLQAAQQPAAAPAACRGSCSAFSSCTPATATAAASTPCSRRGVAGMATASNPGCSAPGTTAMHFHGQQLLLQRQPASSQGLVAAAGTSSPLNGSGRSGSNEVVHPAAWSIEQDMLQELASAATPNSYSNSTAALLTVPAASTPALQQNTWHHTRLQQQQQQQLLKTVSPFVHSQHLQPMQLQGSMHPMQLQGMQVGGLPTPAHHHRPSPSPGVTAHMTTCLAPGIAAVEPAFSWVPGAACGRITPSPCAADATQQQQQQQGLLHVPSGPASARVGGGAATAGRGGGSRLEVMAWLQGRLQLLQGQMDDVQQMLGLLPDC